MLAAAVSILMISALLKPAAERLPEGVVWMNPPVIEDAEIGRHVEFVVFASEGIADGTGTRTTGLWEVDTSGEGRIVPRLRLRGFSSGTLRVNGRAPRPDVVRRIERLQDGLREDMYLIDYGTWDVRPLWFGGWVSPLFEQDGAVYLGILGEGWPNGGMGVLAPGSDRIEDVGLGARYVRRVSWTSRVHLLRLLDAPEPSYVLWDSTSGEVVEVGELPADVEEFRMLSAVVCRDDLRWCAMHLVSGMSPIDLRGPLHEFQFTESVIRVLDVASGETARIPVGLLAAPASGREFVTWGLVMRFADDAKLLYTPRAAPPGEDGGAPPGDGSVFAFDLETGRIEAADDRAAELDSHRPRWDRRSVPEELARLMEPAWRGDRAVAFAFLRLHGVEFRVPGAELDTVVEFSDDGGRFLLKMRNSGRDDTFFLGDLDDGTLREIPAPGPLVRGHVGSIVRTGGR